MRQRNVIALSLLFSTQVYAAGLDSLSNSEVAGGLKEALSNGSIAAVAKLGQTDGFLKNQKVKIPLPSPLNKVEGAMRTFGMGKQADELIVAMNRAAEAAVPEAKTLLLDSVKHMTLQDAKGILTGGDDAATQYFKRTTKDPLSVKFLPIVKQATDKVGLAQTYNNYAGQAAQFGVGDKKKANIENYVTDKALDGLYTMIGDEERAIRQDPLGQGGKLISKVFGALK